MEITARAAGLAGACHLFTKWVPGTITNRDQILGKEELKIVDMKDEPAKGFERHLLERRPVMPDLVVVLNPMENFTLLHECAQENIPSIGLIDTNADPTKVTYVIPGNDDRYVCSAFADSHRHPFQSRREYGAANENKLPQNQSTSRLSRRRRSRPRR